MVNEYDHGEVQVDDNVDFRYGKTAHTAMVVIDQTHGSPQKKRKSLNFNQHLKLGNYKFE